MSTLQLKISLDSDDCYEQNGAIATYDLWAGNMNDGKGDYDVDAGLRFQNVTIPNSATIDSATLTLYAEVSASDPSTATIIKGVDEDNTPTWSSSNRPSQRTKTAANVSWAIPAITAPNAYTTPDIKTIIQEIVNRAGWASGNALAVVIENNGNLGGTDVKKFYDYNNGQASYYATLDITYTEAAGETLTTTITSTSSLVEDKTGVNDYIYVTHDHAPGDLTKVRVSTFTESEVITLDTGDNYPESVCIDHQNHYLYYGLVTTPSSCVKVDTVNGIKVDELSWTWTSGNQPMRAVVDEDNGYAYFASDDNPRSNPIEIKKIDLSTFTVVATLTLNAGEMGCKTLAIDTTNGYLYVGCDVSPAKVVKVNLATFTRDSVCTFNTGENGISSNSLDITAGKGYFGTHQPSAYVVKVNLSNMTRDGSLAVGNYLKSSVIDITNGYVYFGEGVDTDSGFCTTGIGHIYKIQLSDFTLNDTLTLNAGDCDLWWGVRDIRDNYSYWCTYKDSSPRLIKVDLGTFTRTGALALTETRPLSLAIDNIQVLAFTGSGGALASGAAVVETVGGGVIYSYIATGGALAGGAATVETAGGGVVYSYTGVGGALAGGAAVISTVGGETIIPVEVAEFTWWPIYPVERTPMFKTINQPFERGKEQRLSSWSKPKHTFKLKFDSRRQQIAREIYDFFIARKGAYESFRIEDWIDSHYMLDNFDNGAIGSKWTQTPGNGSITEDTALHLAIANGVQGVWNGNEATDTAPVVYQEPATSEFQTTVKLNDYIVNDNTHAGIALFDGRSKAYLWGRLKNIASYQDGLYLAEVNAAPPVILANNSSITLPVWLRILYKDRKYTWTFSTDGETFTSIYELSQVPNVLTSVGPCARNWGSYNAIDVSFNEFDPIYYRIVRFVDDALSEEMFSYLMFNQGLDLVEVS